MKSQYMLLGVGILVMIIAGIYSYSRIPDSGKPEIEIIPNTYDFGNIGMDEVGTTFIVKNRGNAPLKILRVSTSCGCTTAEVEEEEIPPKAETKLKVRMDSKVMGNISGKVLRTIYVRSNDPRQEEVEVTITANIIR